MNAMMGATQPLLDWIAAHPYQTVFHVVNGVVLLTPAAATVPFFSALGLSAGGPVGGTSSPTHSGTYSEFDADNILGSTAASIMSYFGYVPAGGIYATAQSAAMGGYGASIAAGAAQASALVSSGAAWLFGRNGTGV
jgi:hypothetical protein